MRFSLRLISFCVAGGTGALLELLSFNVLYSFSSFWASKLFALMIALCVNFAINRNITFSASSVKKREQIPKYIMVYSVAIIINYISSLTANHFLGDEIIYANISAAIGILMGVPVSFLGSSLWVFKKSPKQAYKK